ncbi:uncharacterized protein T551_03170 [Pneumocystis jirovecii RU7]|uniref:PH domain-containing protein n=1 Tax=Pneumocystis jirovecii (strain RU7) TaxID=1408657 RepID=A0A0W4ZFP6_PNEJ7|nr:uncharacterized protein T551_03170 [Pneumocystis jirovecii RU7]KTW27176.1 hypothetical protein T551_03170 [Pneumocystis jirovecii RU7]
MGKKTPMNTLDLEKNSSYFDDDKNSIFLRMKNRHFSILHSNLSKIFSPSREIKQEDKGHKNKENVSIKKGDQQSKQSKESSVQKANGFISHLHLCRPLQTTSSLFHVPFSLAMRCAISSSAVLFFMPTKAEYFSDQVSSLTQFNDSLLFSFERGIGMFVLIEGALLHYGLYDNDMCKPKHVIRIQHNTSIRVLNHIEGTRWILELVSSIDVSDEGSSNNDELTLQTSILKNVSCLDVSLKNDKQKEIVLFSIATQKSLNQWLKIFQQEISRSKKHLLSSQNSKNNTFDTNSNILSTLLPLKNPQGKRPPIPVRPDFIDLGSELVTKQLRIECKETNQSNNHDNSDKHSCEEISKETIHTPKVLDSTINKIQKKDYSPLAVKKPSVLSLFTSPDVPSVSDCPSLEASNSEDSRTPSYASSASIPASYHKENTFYQLLNTHGTQKEILTLIPQCPLLSQHIVRNNI